MPVVGVGVGEVPAGSVGDGLGAKSKTLQKSNEKKSELGCRI